MSRRRDIPRMAEVRVFLRGGLALDAFYLLARDVDGTGELVGLEHPAFHHILDLPRSEVEILGRLPQADFLAFFVFDLTNLLARQRRRRDTPHKDTPALSLALIHRSAWKKRSRNFALKAFCELRHNGFLRSSRRNL